MTCFKVGAAEQGRELHPGDREEDIHKLPQRGETKIELFLCSSKLMFQHQVFCWMDKWHGMTMADIRALEDETKAKLDEERNKVQRKKKSFFGVFKSI